MALKEGVKVFFIVLICILVLGFLLYLAMKLISNQDKSDNNEDYSKAVEIIDGDTFKLGNGEIVRLLCVDTPEKNQEGYDEAVSFLGGRLLYSELRLEGNKTDQYGRSLRWVYADDVLINKEIVDLGFGTLFEYDNEDCGLMK